MATVDYRKVLCSLIEDKLVSIEEVTEAIEKVKAMKAPTVKGKPTWIVAEALLKELNECIKSNGKKPARVNDTSIAVLEKMIRIDKRDKDHASELIKWAQGHDFWSTVILSPEKFRKHYDAMVGQRERDARVNKPATVITTPQSDKWERAIEERRKESVPMPKGFKEGLMKRVAK